MTNLSISPLATRYFLKTRVKISTEVSNSSGTTSFAPSSNNGCSSLLHVIDFAILAPAYAEGAAPLIADGEEILTKGREFLKNTGFKGMVVDKLLTGQPAQVIAEEAEGAHYALILMGARGVSPLKQMILGSVSKDVLYRVSRTIVGIVYP